MGGQLALNTNVECVARSMGCLVRVCCCRGEVTWTSRAAGRPLLQTGRRMSAGLERESGTTPAASREGARAAVWVAENRTSLMAL